MTMETPCSKVIFPNYSKKKPAEDTVVPPLWVTREKMFVFLGLFVHAAVRGGTCAFTLKIVSTLIQKQLTRREASDLDIEASHGEPGSCRARPVNVDDGLEDMRWIPWSRGREVARGVLRSSPEPEKRPIFCHRRAVSYTHLTLPTICSV